MQILNNRYRFEKVLGQGGMGKVYLCTDINNQQLVAIKECVPKGQRTENTIRRINREYYFMSKIQHPHVVRGIDFFKLHGRYFIVMEYVRGITLKEFIIRYPHSIDFEKQLQIAIQICRGIANLNEYDIVHRDIKPTNIILTEENLLPKILDLGIAKSINSDLVSITHNDLIGTPQYMSPEQIEDKWDVGKNTDVFALGVLFYQFFSWSRSSPFHSETMVSTIQKVLHFNPPPLFPGDKEKSFVAYTIFQALQKNPQQRIDSVKTIIEMFSNRESKFPVTDENIRQPHVVARPSRYKRVQKKKGNSKSIAFVVLSMFFAIGIVWIFSQEKSHTNRVEKNISERRSTNKKVRAIPHEADRTKQTINWELYQQHMIRGVSYHEQKKYREACKHYTKAVTMNPQDFLAYCNRGIAYRELGKLKEALNDFNKAIELNPNDSDSYFNRGNVYNDVRNEKQAVADYSSAIRLNPRSHIAYTSRGDMYVDLGKYEEALDDFNQAVKIKPNYSRVYVSRGLLYKHLKKYNKALIDYLKALQLDPNDAFAHTNLGNIYNIQNNYQKALASYNNALRLSPDNGKIYLNRANIYYQQRQFEWALRDLNKALQLSPNNHQVYDSRKLVYEQLGRYEEALDDYNKIRHLNTDNYFFYAGRAIVYKRLRRYDKALEDFDKSIELNPAEYTTYVNRGLIYERQKRYEKVVEDYNTAIRLNPNDYLIYSNRGIVFNTLQRYREAIQDFNQAIALNPNDYVSYGTRGAIYVNQGAYTQALSDLNKAIKLNPRDGEYYGNRGVVYYHQQKFAKAISDWEKSMALGGPIDILKIRIEEAKKLLQK
ncbi:serine/threonine-protein kinase [Candidatus Uabimicrobium amorphum]|uniref:Protein kinase domain-containing protein n=1 Tax=Uabimicrobium amorphum TaxID=2596890 RepID=A0A5S9F633_UABAM|nr:serine/threonine-protein kinase [Candidatus Uabimicrobium amorphum]BBM85902.1 hypothetical protein UABAM_04284 [Candidatus Uabimicrobium amorphum]